MVELQKMMNQLSDQSKINAFNLASEIKVKMKPLFEKHMQEIISANFQVR